MKSRTIENLLKQCRVVAENAYCARRRFGAIITTPEGVHISDGYNGSMRGSLNCGKDTPCGKDLMNEPHYTSYEYCAAIHAEENSILNAVRNGIGISLQGCSLFLNSDQDGECDRPCKRCRRAIVQVGITDVYYVDKKGEIHHDKVFPLYQILEDGWMKARGK